MNFTETITYKNRIILKRFLEEISLDDLNKIPEGFSNNIIWNIAHVVVTQQLLVYKLSGLPMHVSEEMVAKYRNKTNQVVTELIEIKPKKQSILESKANNRDRAVVAVNYAKWDAAQKWCRRNGLTFRVVTEEDIFHQGRKR